MYIIAGLSFLFVFILKFLKFKLEVTTVECLIGAAFSCLLSFGFYQAGMAITVHNLTSDVENIHGYVIDKHRKQESCPSGWTDYPSDFCTEYSTRSVIDYCTTTTDRDGNVSEECTYKTQYYYDYSYEVKWFVSATVQNYEISRVDRQGVNMPDRWSIVKKLDPVTLSRSYTNWLLVPNNSFVYPKFLNYNVPQYPNVFDYYNVNLVLGDSTFLVPEWNDTIREFLKKNGHKKEVNIIAHVTSNPIDYLYSVMYSWSGGKKNDVNLFFGVENGKIKWFTSSSFAKGSGNALFHDKIKSAIMKIEDKSDFKLALDIALSNIEKNYNRVEMSKFEHIKESIVLSMTANIVILIISLLSGGFISIILSRNEYRDRR